MRNFTSTFPHWNESWDRLWLLVSRKFPSWLNFATFLQPHTEHSRERDTNFSSHKTCKFIAIDACRYFLVYTSTWEFSSRSIMAVKYISTFMWCLLNSRLWWWSFWGRRRCCCFYSLYLSCWKSYESLRWKIFLQGLSTRHFFIKITLVKCVKKFRCLLPNQLLKA